MHNPSLLLPINVFQEVKAINYQLGRGIVAWPNIIAQIIMLNSLYTTRSRLLHGNISRWKVSFLICIPNYTPPQSRLHQHLRLIQQAAHMARF